MFCKLISLQFVLPYSDRSVVSHGTKNGPILWVPADAVHVTVGRIYDSVYSEQRVIRGRANLPINLNPVVRASRNNPSMSRPSRRVIDGTHRRLVVRTRQETNTLENAPGGVATVTVVLLLFFRELFLPFCRCIALEDA